MARDLAALRFHTGLHTKDDKACGHKEEAAHSPFGE